jgi:phosphoserine phosphatase
MLCLVAFDMEGTLTADPTVWELMHRRLGTWESHGLRYWEQYRAGEVGYDDFARLDVAVWAGAPVALLEECAAEVPLMAGCADLLAALRRAGARTAIISNGLLTMADRLVRECGVTAAFANHALDADGRLTGDLDVRVPYEAKGRVLRRLMDDWGITAEQTAAVGDSRADAAMFREAGLGIAFRPSDPHVVSGAHHVVEAEDLGEVRRILLGA